MKLHHLGIFGLSVLLLSGGCSSIKIEAPLLTQWNSDYVPELEGIYKDPGDYPKMFIVKNSSESFSDNDYKYFIYGFPHVSKVERAEVRVKKLSENWLLGQLASQNVANDHTYVLFALELIGNRLKVFNFPIKKIPTGKGSYLSRSPLVDHYRETAKHLVFDSIAPRKYEKEMVAFLKYLQENDYLSFESEVTAVRSVSEVTQFMANIYERKLLENEKERLAQEEKARQEK